jgi:hypothetical protein
VSSISGTSTAPRRWRQLWVLSELTFLQLKRSSGAHLAWIFAGGLVLFYGFSSLRGEGRDALVGGLDALRWPALFSAFAFFATHPSASEAAGLASLARLRGLPVAALPVTVALARLRVVLPPLLLAATLLWLAALTTFDRSTLLRWPLALASTWFAICALGVCLAALAALSEQLAPRRPRRMLLALILVPALLFPVVPELPSLWHSFSSWNDWSLSLLRLR